ncbi:MAG: hypothetical protein O9282_02840 [Flavobacterium sp.]|uniref:hypothetical protein n=1 Tax=Flavobacterium sp. TaxID=239 RepID=UPI0022CAF536|nr:hypothetical protein [Flavobacterium sp.]MCZ8330229.1 hypothetical protein [Flavobacterium sp.]
MKKSLQFLITILFYVVATLQSLSQTLGQDTEGYSTIIVPAVNLNLDIANNVATFSFYKKLSANDYKLSEYSPLIDCFLLSDDRKIEECFNEKFESLKKEKKIDNILLGIDLKGNTKEGLGNFFSGEKVTPSASIGAIFGYNWSTINIKNDFSNPKSGNEKIQNEIKIEKDNITKKKLIQLVSNDTGIEAKNLLIPSGIKTKEAIAFCKSRIVILKDITYLKNIKAEKLEEKNKRLLDINSLEKITAEVIKHFSNQENDNIYKKYLESKVIYLSIFKEDIFKNPFKKELWDETQKKIGEEKLILDYEIKDINKNNDFNSYNISSLINSYEIILKSLEKLDESEDSGFYNNVYINSNLVYLRGTFTGSDFKYDLKNDETTIESRFVDKTFNGYSVEMGFTKNYRNYNFLGLSSSLNYANNLNALTSTTFKLEKEDTTISDGTFTSSEEIKALSGIYDTFLRYDINFDYLRLIPLKENLNSTPEDKQSHLYLSINPYLRHRIYENANTLKNNTIVGIGLHAYNSKDNKLMGGLFIQTNDLFGVHTDEGSTLGKRISFGVVAKFSFKGLKVE